MGSVIIKHFQYGKDEMDYLKSADEKLGAAIEQLGKIERVVMPDLFAALVYAIVGQLISVKAVNTIWDRMQNQFQEITPKNIAKQDVNDIQKCGLTMKKAVCIKNISLSIEEGHIDLYELYDLSDEEVIKRLMTINGVGKWTAEMLLIHAMERRDVVSWGDIAIRRGMMKLYGLHELTKEQFQQYRLAYSPQGSVASIYLWQISSE